MVRDRLPMPRFWYLPRGEKAVVVMSGDDHSPVTNTPGGTAFAFERFKQLSPPGCVVANWDCVRSTSYIYPGSTSRRPRPPATSRTASRSRCTRRTAAAARLRTRRREFEAMLSTQLGQFGARYTGVPAPVSSRNHCVEWLDWASVAKIELAAGDPDGRELLPLPGLLDRRARRGS